MTASQSRFPSWMQPLIPTLRRVWHLVRPRLGILRQYPPRAASLPASRTLAVPKNGLRFSIVTPSYNQAEFLERTLLSVLQQGYPALEYVVQDGGSTDGSADVIKRYSDSLSSWACMKDRGQSHALNLAFARTSGEIMAWLNSDDILLPGALNCVADFFHSHPDVDVVYGHRLLIDEDDREIGRWRMPHHQNDILSWADFIPQETLFWRRRIWEKSGASIDESLHFAIDWDLLLRFRKAEARFARLPYFLGAFRVHLLQKTSSSIHDVGIAEMAVLRERELGRSPSKAEVDAVVRRYLLRQLPSEWIWRLRQHLPWP